MKEKPGVMLYFDRLPYLNRMDDTQRGKLFLWIMEYAQYGVIPEIEDAMLGINKPKNKNKLTLKSKARMRKRCSVWRRSECGHGRKRERV